MNNLVQILLVIPTYEPYYMSQPGLEEFYTRNFDSFYHAQGDFDLKLAITDFASSPSYKGFLRDYVRDRQGCYLIDGHIEASSFVAVNITLNNFDFDYVVYAACDLRTRDVSWLQGLLTDFDDPKVQITIPTVTDDGVAFIEQTQSGPVERASQVIDASKPFNLHCAVYSRRFLQHFGNRYPDILDGYCTEIVTWYQMRVLGYDTKLNFRVNMVHDSPESVQFKPGSSAAGWRSRNAVREADTQRLLNRANMLPRISLAKGVSLAQRLRYHLSAMKVERWRYLYNQLFARRALEDFSRLDVPTKVAVMKALFYRPWSEYQQYPYSIFHSESDNDNAAVSSAAPAVIRS